MCLLTIGVQTSYDRMGFSPPHSGSISSVAQAIAGPQSQGKRKLTSGTQVSIGGGQVCRDRTSHCQGSIAM